MELCIIDILKDSFSNLNETKYSILALIGVVNANYIPLLFLLFTFSHFTACPRFFSIPSKIGKEYININNVEYKFMNNYFRL